MNSDSDHSTRSIASIHGFRDGAHYKSQYGCLAFEEPSLNEYPLKTYLPQESPTLNPLLAIASHQWFDRLFNTGSSTQTSNRSSHDRRYSLASQSSELSRFSEKPEYDTSEDNGNAQAVVASKSIDKRAGRGSTEYKIPFLHMSETETRNYATNHVNFSSGDIELDDRQMCPLDSFPGKLRVSNKSEMCDPNTLFIKSTSEQFSRNPFNETLGESGVPSEDHTSTTFKSLPASSALVPEFAQKITVSYSSHPDIEGNTRNIHPTFHEVDCPETEFVGTSTANCTVVQKSPDVQSSSGPPIASTVGHSMMDSVRTSDRLGSQNRWGTNVFSQAT
ncbi:unnamed protein product [Echinostoma caproni]|uniref:Transcription factor n=1 Tax=Echinostoma caproni TaxID=27848 RepID=A0A183A9H3_9TREM|nr:unnamed protein product [Echinostoma caproni]